MSDSITDAKDRLPIGSEPFVKVNGDLVALDIFDLLDCCFLVSPDFLITNPNVIPSKAVQHRPIL